MPRSSRRTCRRRVSITHPFRRTPGPALLLVLHRAALLGDLGLVRCFRGLELRRRLFDLLLMLLLDLGLLARRFRVALGFRRIQLRLRVVALRFLPRELLLLQPRLVDPAAVFLGLPGEQLLLRRLLRPHPLLLLAARALEDPLFGRG